MARPLGSPERALAFLRRALHLPDHPVEQAQQRRDFSNDWLVAQLLRLIEQRARLRDALLVAASGAESARLRGPLPQPIDLLAQRRIARHWQNDAENRHVGAALDVGKGAGRVDRLADHVDIRHREQIRQRAHAVPVAVEAIHPQVQDLRRLFAADVRRFAGLAVHRGPVLRIPVEDRGGALPNIRGAPDARREERGPDGVSSWVGRTRARVRQLPGRRQPFGGVLAHRRARTLQHALTECAACEQNGGEADADQRAPALAFRIAGQRREQVFHRREAILAFDRKPAQQDLAQPGGDTRAVRRLAQPPGGDRLEETGQRIGGERPLAVKRLVKRDAEAELIGARVGGAGRGTAPAPCTPAFRSTIRSGSAPIAIVREKSTRSRSDGSDRTDRRRRRRRPPPDRSP